MSFQLLETMRWDPPTGFLLLTLHLCRLERSARCLGFHYDGCLLRARLTAAVENVPRVPSKVRVVLSEVGSVKITVVPLGSDPLPGGALVRFAATPVSQTEPTLFHKTTDRHLYQERLDALPDCYDVLLWNEAGFVTELTRFNVLAYTDQRWQTPPVEHGLLKGTLCQELRRRGLVEVAALTKQEVGDARALVAVNSVRGLVRLRPQTRDTWTIEPVTRLRAGEDFLQPLLEGVRQIMEQPGDPEDDSTRVPGSG